MRDPTAFLKRFRYEISLVSLTVISFIALRAAGMANNPELDDHDSNGYIAFADIWRSGDWNAIINMNPDATFFYPFLIALFSHLTGSYESAGRLVCLLASAVTLCAVYYTARKLCGGVVAAIAALLIAINPFFIRFSYSVLTEPLYVALIALLLAVFIGQYRSPTARGGAVMGLLAGLAFLTRIEGVLFLAAIPFFQAGLRLLLHRDIPWSRVGKSMLVFTTVFTLLAAPQVWRVSHVMDTPSLNGRSVWSILLNSNAGDNPDEKIYGLAFDPAITNLDYLQANPDAVGELIQDEGLTETAASYGYKVLRNLKTLHDTNLVALVGVPLLAFSVIGFFALIRAGRSTEAIVILGFMATSLLAPLLHNVVLRHIAVIGPMTAIFAGAGLADAGRTLRDHLFMKTVRADFVAFALTMLIALSYLPNLGALYEGDDDANHEYDWDSLQAPVASLQDAIAERTGTARVLSRKTYVPMFADAEMVKAPYTDLSGLLRYIELNDVHFLFYSERGLRSFPFAQSIESKRWKRNFKVLYAGRDENGLKLALYAVRRARDE